MCIKKLKIKKYRGLMLILFLAIIIIISILQIRHTKQNINPSSKQINISDYHIKGNGKRDNTESIQNLFDNLNTKKTKIIYFPKGTYIISSPIRISKSIIIKGNNATFKLSPHFKSNKYGQGFFYSDSVNNITLDGLYFDGNNLYVKKDVQNNFVALFYNSSYITIEDCTVINVNGKGKNLNSSFSFIRNSNHILVKGNLIKNSNGGAIFFQGKDSKAINNKVYNLKDVAFVANGRGSQNTIFKNNITSSVSSGSIGIENGASKAKILNNKIYNFTDGYGVGILKIKDNTNSLSQDITIRNNKIYGNDGFNPCNGIAIVKAKNVSVSNNEVSSINTNNPHNNSIYIGTITNNIRVYNNKIHNTIAPTLVSISQGENIYIHNNKQILDK